MGRAQNSSDRTEQITLRVKRSVLTYQSVHWVEAGEAETVVNALIEQAHQLPTELYKSLTWDRGSAFLQSPEQGCSCTFILHAHETAGPKKGNCAQAGITGILVDKQ